MPSRIRSPSNSMVRSRSLMSSLDIILPRFFFIFRQKLTSINISKITALSMFFQSFFIIAIRWQLYIIIYIIKRTLFCRSVQSAPFPFVILRGAQRSRRISRKKVQKRFFRSLRSLRMTFFFCIGVSAQISPKKWFNFRKTGNTAFRRCLTHEKQQ